MREWLMLALVGALAAYSLIVFVTYIIFVAKTPGCGKRILQCIKKDEIVVILILILIQALILFSLLFIS
ncbi:hypothetical protein TTX_0856 [Thermoproteus tenax Kra 1]|uniref:Uncharacterized protein n=1 Tax=Thermoproteus tenax (strain ATCC 35583 / DSM 2078 / JCM 9277 / NBRC 100435 / Kra 1) TaxID=768679 RepID=G4RPL6_THETK|nr:hypothetical protein TTX_0856 [Thermoproteus tenax Kra 1]